MLKLQDVQSRYGALTREEFVKKVQCEWLVTDYILENFNDDAKTTVFQFRNQQTLEEMSREQNFNLQSNLILYPIIKRIPNAATPIITMGRAKSNDIFILDKSISKVHAYFGFNAETGRRTISDMDSTNGTFLGGERLIPNVAYSLKTGDRLIFGQLAYSYYTPKSFYEVFLC